MLTPANDNVPFADLAAWRRCGSNAAGSRPHSLADPDLDQPYRGKRITVAEMLAAMTPESRARREAERAANDNVSAERRLVA